MCGPAAKAPAAFAAAFDAANFSGPGRLGMTVRSATGVCRFAFSSDLNVLVRCRVDRVLPPGQAEDLIGDEPLDVEADLVLDGAVFRTAQSSQAVFDAWPERGAFRPQQLVFASKVRDLPRHCSLVLRLRGRPIRPGETPRCYRAVLPLFNGRAVMRQGSQLLPLVAVADAEGVLRDGTEAADAPARRDRGQQGADLRRGPRTKELREALRLAKAVDLYDRGCVPSASPGFERSEEVYARQALEALEAAGVPWLSVQLPVFPHPVVFAEGRYDQDDVEAPSGILSAPLADDVSGADVEALASAKWLLQPFGAMYDRGGSGARCFKACIDPDAQYEHPALLKSIRLARSSRVSRTKDREVRPDADELRRLNELIGRTRRHFSAEEKHLLFRFRYSLTDQPGALTKFLHAVDWSDVEERQHAIELLGHWSPIDIDDALELLSKDFRGIREVRQYAVERLERASDGDLQLYLLQLVQALRYEPIEERGAHLAGAEPAQVDEATLVVATASSSPRRQSSGGGAAAGGGNGGAVLTRFLIRRAVRCRALATLFYWYVVAETDDHERGALFDRVRQQFLEALGESADGQSIRRLLERQAALRRKLLWALQCAKVMKRDRIEKKVDRFRQALAAEPPPEEGAQASIKLDLVGGLDESIPLPVDPSVSLLKIFPDQSFLLKSAMNPGVLTCQVCATADPRKTKSLKKIMVKEGDDLRQDQLVLQLIILMDSILKKYGLDLQLTPYQVIALSTNDGIIEFVPDGQNISAILKDHNNDIQQFFRSIAPYTPKPSAGDGASGAGSEPASSSGYGPHNSYGIRPEVLENFIRSSAGYCVITYILGIGDRHLDNLMVTKEGRLFHIDFGFILGKDPKPFPPPMRICKEMVEGMGGNTSKGYESFKSKCCQAFKILRRHGKLIINLLYLMTDSGIKDLSGDPQFSIMKVEQKFQEMMDDEQAEKHFLSLIEESVSALFPVVMERFHRFAIAMQ